MLVDVVPRNCVLYADAAVYSPLVVNFYVTTSSTSSSNWKLSSLIQTYVLGGMSIEESFINVDLANPSAFLQGIFDVAFFRLQNRENGSMSSRAIPPSHALPLHDK
jgi:hypothetical protein